MIVLNQSNVRSDSHSVRSDCHSHPQLCVTSHRDQQASGFVSGEGTDDVGFYTIKGQWNGRTGKLVFTKRYSRGTGNPDENLGHTVEYRGSVQQSQLAAGVRGTWYVNIPGGYSGSGRFHLWPSDLAIKALQAPQPTAPRQREGASVPSNGRGGGGESIELVSINDEAECATATESTRLLLPVPSAPRSPPTSTAQDGVKMYRVVDGIECVVCFEGSINTVLVPCGHVALCSGCAHRLSACPICRSDIAQVQVIA
jgi:hypothetical protein